MLQTRRQHLSAFAHALTVSAFSIACSNAEARVVKGPHSTTGSQRMSHPNPQLLQSLHSTHLPLAENHPSDFDFFQGHWLVKHRRLKDRLAGSSDWEHFDGSCCMHKTLGGFGNIDDNILQLPAGTYRAVTLRSFDPKTQTWSIWWLDGRSPGALDVPVVGKFERGVGSFLARDRLNDRPIMVRFLWTQPEPERPQWEQAFSADDGKSWETNWVMNFFRV
jgi:hypothetical protein